ncbi:2-oxoglutarate-dependent dioxygenase 21, chloroplastic, partial [Linum perenne]
LLQVVNHGIKQSVLDEALKAADDFFKLPGGEKAKLMSNDVYKPVRYGTSIKDGMDKVQFWRVFLKHYANPITKWIHLWPQNPPNYRNTICTLMKQLYIICREKMAEYCGEVRKLSIEIADAMTESLGLGPSYLAHKLDGGMQTMVVNCYPPCPNPELTLGLPPHSDYSCLTVVLQTSSGLEIFDQRDATWKSTPNIPGALLVHVGDHLEVLSNGVYKSVLHRAALNSHNTRISIASLQSLGMDDKMEVANELLHDGAVMRKYKGSSFRDFLDLLSKNDIGTHNFKSFIDSLKIHDK